MGSYKGDMCCSPIPTQVVTGKLNRRARRAGPIGLGHTGGNHAVTIIFAERSERSRASFWSFPFLEILPEIFRVLFTFLFSLFSLVTLGVLVRVSSGLPPSGLVCSDTFYPCARLDICFE